MSTGQLLTRRIVGVEEHFLLPDLLGRIPGRLQSTHEKFADYASVRNVARGPEASLQIKKPNPTRP